MTAALERAHPLPLVQHATDYNREQIDLIKATVAAGTSDLEFQMFMEVARTMGLSPLQKQIHAVMRWDNQEKRQKMVIQTGIDGYRLIAARTGAHLGTTDAVYGPLNKDGYPEWAQVTTKRLVHGQIAEFPATAFWDEYVQKVKDGSPNSMWRGRPKGQLGKCAEALSLRKAFPAELSGVYSDIEMQQADSESAQPIQQARTVDVTREVSQAAGVQPQQNAPARSEALIAWEEKIGLIGKRLGELGLRTEAVAILDIYPNWKTDTADAAAAYEEMKRLGMERKAPEPEPVEAEIVAESRITDGQRRALMGQLGRLNLPDSSAARSAFYAWMVAIPEGTRTNALSEDDAQGLIDLLSVMDPGEIDATAAQFLREVKL